MKTIIALSCALLALSGCIASDQVDAAAPASRAEGAFQFSEANTAIPEATSADGSHAVAGSAGLYQSRLGNRPTMMIVPGSGGAVAYGTATTDYRGAQSPSISGSASGPTFHSTTKTGLPCHYNGGKPYHITKTGNPHYSGCVY